MTSVLQNSPADNAGLLPERDYILSSSLRPFDSADSFYHLIAESKEKEISFVVWDGKQEKMRRVLVKPSENWGGQGL